jgi:hypothetical protein
MTENKPKEVASRQRKAIVEIEENLLSRKPISTRKLKSLLCRLGFEIRNGGNHKLIFYEGKRALDYRGRSITFPNHYQENFPQRFLREIRGYVNTQIKGYEQG